MTGGIMMEEEVTVDFPQAEEVVTSRQYTIRVSSLDAARVAVSLDGGSWQPCRFALGHWWYDWAFYSSGSHEVKARIDTRTGETLISPSRKFEVRLA